MKESTRTLLWALLLFSFLIVFSVYLFLFFDFESIGLLPNELSYDEFELEYMTQYTQTLTH